MSHFISIVKTGLDYIKRYLDHDEAMMRNHDDNEIHWIYCEFSLVSSMHYSIMLYLKYNGLSILLIAKDQWTACNVGVIV